MAFEPVTLDPAALARFIAAESARWAEIARVTGVRMAD
jgi:tripartite-type tricarboxylate transporter receptor subunit TctC